MNKDTNNHLNSDKDEEDNEKKELRKSSARLCEQLIYIFEDEFPDAQHSYRKYGCEYLADIYKEIAGRVKSLRNDLRPIIYRMEQLNMDTTLEYKTLYRAF